MGLDGIDLTAAFGSLNGLLQEFTEGSFADDVLARYLVLPLKQDMVQASRRAVQLRPEGGQISFVRLSARVANGAHVW